MSFISYVCEKCGKRWPTEEEAIKCEESHTRAEVIDKQLCFECGRQGYPRYLRISMEDGTECQYEFHGVIGV